MLDISIHALRKEGDLLSLVEIAPIKIFLSTPSARRATVLAVGFILGLLISIHALRKEGDRRLHTARHGCWNFYPRPPQGGRRRGPAEPCRPGYFYPRPPQGGRQAYRAGRREQARISIHALRKEGDSCTWSFASRQQIFLSTPSARRATGRGPAEPCRPEYFYPRPPQGGRRPAGYTSMAQLEFLSTPSARRATGFLRIPAACCPISIHALRKEGDPSSATMRWRNRHFYPRPPQGGRPYSTLTFSGAGNFYPRPPQGGRPNIGEPKWALINISIHALRKEGDSHLPYKPHGIGLFLSTPSARRATL